MYVEKRDKRNVGLKKLKKLNVSLLTTSLMFFKSRFCFDVFIKEFENVVIYLFLFFF